MIVDLDGLGGILLVLAQKMMLNKHCNILSDHAKKSIDFIPIKLPSLLQQLIR